MQIYFKSAWKFKTLQYLESQDYLWIEIKDNLDLNLKRMKKKYNNTYTYTLRINIYTEDIYIYPYLKFL